MEEQMQMVSYTAKDDVSGVRFFQSKSDSLPAWAENIRDEPFEDAWKNIGEFLSLQDCD